MAKKTTKTPDKKTKKKPVTMADLADQINDLKATIRRMDPKLNMCVNKTEAIQQSLAAHWSKREEHNDWMMPKVMDIHRGIERLLSTPQDVTGAPVTIPEQGLEPGDYTDASKEVAAKPIGPYVTRVMCDGYEWRVICGMDQLKRYRIHRIEGEFEYCVSVQRHEFTVID